MLKEKRQLFEVFFMATDLVVVSIAWCLAYWLRFNTEFIPAPKGVPSFGNYLTMLLFVWLIWVYVYRRFGLYRPMRGVRPAKELLTLVNANTFSVLLLIAVTYLFREKDVPFSRLVFLYFWGLSLVLSVVQRGLVRGFLRELRRRGYNLRYLLIVGAGKVAGDIASRVRLNKELGIQLVGCLSRDGLEKRGPKGIPVIGSYADLAKVLREVDVDQLVVALPLEESHVLPMVMSQIGDSLVDVKIVPDLYQFVSIGGSIEEFEGLPVIGVQSSPLEGINFMLKRALDVCLASVILILISPLMLLIGLVIKLTSRGPIFYWQERVSYDGSRFNIVKFRTMRCDAESDGPRFATESDERVTFIGRVLRSTSLDELPQLINVLRGDMAIVGPRPERPVFIEEFRRRVPRYMLRHKVPAGMTGWAQIHGWRGNTSIDKRIEYDLYYIENWSLLLDFKILVLTLWRGFVNRNAY